MDKQEQKIQIYDPFRGAFCMVPVSQAKKLVEVSKDVEKEIKKLEKTSVED